MWQARPQTSRQEFTPSAEVLCAKLDMPGVAHMRAKFDMRGGLTEVTGKTSAR